MKKSIYITIAVVIAVIAIAGILRFVVGGDEDTWICENGAWVKHGNPDAAKPTTSCSGSTSNANTTKNTNDKSTVTPAEELEQVALANKFGWLGAGEDGTDMDFIRQSGAGWMRPHPGPFVWDMLQPSATAEYDYTKMDELVALTQSYGLNLLITIWPFAEWDQAQRADAADCAVSSEDEFLLANDKKGRPSYLPLHRCNPNDWTAYERLVVAVVERYDGDGTDDMDGLRYPIKHWEVLNEPDLGTSDQLTFYKEGPEAYAELLRKTMSAIKNADETANVLIAGAAGTDDRFLNFYRTMFTNVLESRLLFEIGNVHCISNDKNTLDFNVADYRAMLAEFEIDAPVWVTEAEQMGAEGFTQNVEQTQTSVDNALSAGAQKIFFTRYDLADTRTDMSEIQEGTEDSATQSMEAYQEIISGG
ncbi:MAG: hypothetical protein WC505_01360 [Patescibacteria group bacterium]